MLEKPRNTGSGDGQSALVSGKKLKRRVGICPCGLNACLCALDHGFSGAEPRVIFFRKRKGLVQREWCCSLRIQTRNRKKGHEQEISQQSHIMRKANTVPIQKSRIFEESQGFSPDLVQAPGSVCPIWYT
jgi:hypothetical protein